MKQYEKQETIDALCNIINATGIFTHQSTGNTYFLKIWYHKEELIRSAESLCAAIGIRCGELKTITRITRKGTKHKHSLTINIQDLADSGAMLVPPKDLVLAYYRTRKRVDELDLEMNRKLDLFIDSLSKEQGILFKELCNNNNIRTYRRKL